MYVSFSVQAGSYWICFGVASKWPCTSVTGTRSPWHDQDQALGSSLSPHHLPAKYPKYSFLVAGAGAGGTEILMGSPDTAKCHYEPLLSQGAAENGDKVDVQIQYYRVSQNIGPTLFLSFSLVLEPVQKNFWPLINSPGNLLHNSHKNFENWFRNSWHNWHQSWHP